MEFTGLESSGSINGNGWMLTREQAGYAKLSIFQGIYDISIPARTINVAEDLRQTGDQSVIMYIDRAEVIGRNGMYAQINSDYGTITVKTE